MLSNKKLSRTLPPIERYRSESTHNSPLFPNSPIYRKLQSMIATEDISVFLDSKRQVQRPQESLKTEELREISLQLSIIRKKHDNSKILNEKQEERMRLFHKEIRGYEEIEFKTIQKQETLKEEIKKVEEEIADKKNEQLKAQATQKSYLHIIERMEIDQLQLEKKAQVFNKKLRAQSVILDEEQRKKRKKREDLHHTREALSSLELHIQKEIEDRKKELEELEKEASQKLELTVKREKRDRRQIEIAEAAANEHRNRSGIEKRESLMIHRMWFNYEKFKYIDLIKNFSSIEQAFKQAMPGGKIDSITDMVSKLLTRENEYAELLEFVIEAKKKVSFYEEKNRDLENNLKEIEHLLSEDEEFEEVKEEILTCVVRNSEEEKKMRELRAIEEKIMSWTGKLVKKLKSLLSESVKLEEGESLRSKIGVVKELIKKLIPEIKEEGEKEFRLDNLLEEIPDEVRKALTFVKEDEYLSDEEEYEETARKLVTNETSVEKMISN